MALVPSRGPVEVSDLAIPGPFISKAQSGRVNTRASEQIGWSWTETFLLQVSNLADRAFLTEVKRLWRAGEIFDRAHPDYAAIKGAGGGAPRVNGAGQTGAALVIDGAALSVTNWLRVGDLFRVAGLAQALQATADVSTNGAGQATVPILPPLFEGGSPADDALLTIAGVVLRVTLIEPPQWPETGPTDVGELVLSFAEAL